MQEPSPTPSAQNSGYEMWKEKGKKKRQVNLCAYCATLSSQSTRPHPPTPENSETSSPTQDWPDATLAALSLTFGRTSSLILCRTPVRIRAAVRASAFPCKIFLRWRVVRLLCFLELFGNPEFGVVNYDGSSQPPLTCPLIHHTSVRWIALAWAGAGVLCAVFTMWRKHGVDG